MGIIKNKLNEQIQANNLRTYSDTTGTILEYDAITNRAKIIFDSPIGEGTMVRENVPVTSQSGGFTHDGIRPGTQCNIAFSNNNIYAPVITGINNSFYNDKTCSDQGACLVNEKIKNIQKPKDIIPMSSQWIDESNQNQYKYHNDLGQYQDTDVTTQTIDILTKLDKYASTEQGITNLETKSTIKLKENGDIDIFVANNIGLRISAKEHKIYFYGLGIYLNDKEIKPCECTHDDNRINDIAINALQEENIRKEFINNLNLLAIDTEEIKKCIMYLKMIHGMESRYKSLEDKIKDYEYIRDNYDVNNTPIDKIRELNTKIISIKETFEQELADTKGVLNPILN